MKVLQINSVCGIGSTGRIATDIHGILIDQGHESYIAYGRNLPMNCDNLIKIGTDIDNYVHVAKTRVFDKHGFGSKKATIKFIEKVKELDPDIIHLHNIHGYYINVEILFDYLKDANKPVVWTLHDCWSFTGHCAHFDYIGCEKWKTACFKCPEKNNYPSSMYLDNSRNNYLRKKECFSGISNMVIVSPSKWLSKLTKESFLGEYEIRTINNGVDLNIFKPSPEKFRNEHSLAQKFIVLGVASFWVERKGYQHFINLSKKINNDEVMVIVGITDKQKKQLPQNIIGLTKTDDTEKLAEIYSCADVFINLSLEENFPTTNLEALASGTPVITYNTGGSVESVCKETGFVVEKENLSEIYKKILFVKKNGKNHYVNKCIARAYSLYDCRDKYQEYVSLYLELSESKI